MGQGKWILILALCVAISAGIERPAHAFGFTPVAGFGWGSASLNADAGFSPGFRTRAIGGGLLFEYTMSQVLAFEVGGIYMPRGYVEDRASPIQVSFSTFQVPMGFRFYILPGISIGLGIYYSRGFGSITYGATSLEYNKNSYSTDDFGPWVSFGIRYRLAKILSLVAQGRMLYGLPNINQAIGMETRLYDFQVLGGLRIGN